MSVTAQVQLVNDELVTFPGSVLGGAELNAAAAAHCLIAGGIPSLSGSMTLIQPAARALVVGVLVRTNGVSLTIAAGASSDNYVYLDQTGAYSQQQVAAGTTAPNSFVNTICLYYATSNSSGTAISKITQVAGTGAIHPDQTQADFVEAASADVLTEAGSSFANNKNRIRRALTNLGNDTFPHLLLLTAPPAILSDGTNSAAPTLAGPVTVAGNEHVTGNLTVDGSIFGSVGGLPLTPASIAASGDITTAGHYLDVGTTPSVDNTQAFVTNSIVGSDRACCVTVVFSNTAPLGLDFTVTFATPYQTTPGLVWGWTAFDANNTLAFGSRPSAIVSATGIRFVATGITHLTSPRTYKVTFLVIG